MSTLLADDHVQCDVIWNHGKEAIGRSTLENGILLYRRLYPDLRFAIESVAAAPSAVAEDNLDQDEMSHDDDTRLVFVGWHMTGTPAPVTMKEVTMRTRELLSPTRTRNLHKP